MQEIELNKRTPVERLTIASTLIDSVIRDSELELLNEKLDECIRSITSCIHVLALMEGVSQVKDTKLKNYISAITDTVTRCYRECEGSCPLCENDKCQCEKAKNLERLKELAEYRRLDEEGLLLRLPCCNWVSVKDRLPEKAGKYLVTITEGGSVHTTVRRFNPKPKHPEQTEPLFTRHLPYRSGWERATCGVIAWAELPEPYKEG